MTITTEFPTESTASEVTSAPVGELSRERRDLLDVLAKHRQFLVGTATDLTDEQAASRPTVSELSIGGVIKHVAETEQQWANFMTGGVEAFTGDDWTSVDWESISAGGELPPEVQEQWKDGFRMVEGETLESILAEYAAVAAETDRLVATLPSLDTEYALPDAPWFESGAAWSVRRCIVHIVAETSQHAGHADIIRESIDGRKSMG
ncbi:DinB family protein [Dermatobacter hominis]|uniref:DinB family protein n=1 Tax=Dermatobacter hominis TaxID=2884263 RepID=UPI001D0F960B|nr:DinB family protein [Dermatobacter hominis]UDY34500.1 DinB family protein [Dermatobacter hominis]